MDDASQLAHSVGDFLAEHGCLEGVNRLLVGFSGGADSTALLLLLQELGHPLVAHHIHHGLRGAEADADADWCQRFCAVRGIPFRVHRVDVRGRRHPRESIEAAARRCRLDLWCQLCQPGDAIALGHHADDAIEGLFLRLARGANASGLTGLRPLRTMRGVRFLRPLLGLRRDQLRDYLSSLGVDDWREDHTNSDPIHRRNAVRHRLLPAFREVFAGDAGIHRALAALGADADYLETQAGHALRLQMATVDWQRLPPALLPRVLRLWIARETGEDTPPQHTDIARLRQALDQLPDHPVEIPLACGPVLVLDRTGLRLKADRHALPERHWNWRMNPVLPLPEIGAELVVDPAADLPDEAFLRDELPAVLTVRSRRPGDRLVPFGSHRPKKLQDLFTDARIPREQRDGYPVLLAGDTIIWVPGLRRAEFGRISRDQASVRLALRSVPNS